MGSQRSEISVVVTGLDQLRAYEEGQRKLNTTIRAGAKAAQEYFAAHQSGVASLRATGTATDGLAAQIGSLNISLRELKAEQAAIAKGYAEIGRQATAAMQRQQAFTSSQSRTVRQGGAQTASDWRAVVTSGVTNSAAGIAAIGVESARFAAQFDASMTKIRNNTTMTDAQFAQMRKTVLSLGADTGASFDKLAEGAMHVSNFGFKGADAMKILAEANKAATATGGDTATTAQLLAKVLKENGLAAGDAATTMAKLWYAASNSDAKMAQFVETGGRVFAMAAKMGVSFDQTAAAMSTFLGQGLKASDATTQLIGVLNKIIMPSKEVEKRLAAISEKTGVNLVKDFSLAGLQTRQLSGVFDDLREAADKTGVPVERMAVSLFPNLRGTIGALIGTSGSGIQGLHDRLNDLANPMKLQADLQARFTDQQKQSQAQWEKLSNTIKAEFLPVGEHFLRLMQDAVPVVKGVANGVLNTMEAFEKLPKPVQEAALAFGVFRLATIALGNPILGLRGGIAAIITTLRGIPAAAATAQASLTGMAGATGVSAAVARGSVGAGGLGARIAVGGTALLGRVGPLAAIAAGLMGNDAAQWSMEASDAEERAGNMPNLTPSLARVDRIQAQLRAHPNDPKLKADLAAAWASARRIAGVMPTMPVTPPPGLDKGTDAGNAWFDQMMKGDKGSSDADTKAREAAAKRLNDLQDRAHEAENDLRAAEKARDAFTKNLKDEPLPAGDFNRQFAPLASAVSHAQDTLIAAKKALARAENDPATLREIKLGRLLPGYDSDETRRRNNEQYLDRRKDIAGYFAEEATSKYGLDNPITLQRAQEAQRAAIAAEQAKTGEGPELWRLRRNMAGPLFEHNQSQSDAAKAREEIFSQRILQQFEAEQQSRRLGGFSFIGGIPVPNSLLVSQGASATDERLRQIGMSDRPNDIFQTQDQRQAGQESRIFQQIDALGSEFSKLGPETDANRERYKQLNAQLQEAMKALQDFRDGVKATDFQKLMKREEDATNDAIANLSNPRVRQGRETEQQKMMDALSKLTQIADIRDADVTRLKGKSDYEGKFDEVAAAERRARQARGELERYPGEYYANRYNQTYANVQGQVVGAGINFFHGKGDIGDLAKSMGDIIVNTAQEQFLKNLTDPLVQQITKEVLAIEGLTRSLDMTTSAVTGKPVNGQSAAAGASVGVSGAGTGKPSNADTAYANFAKYAGAGLGAYSIFSQGQQQGITLGGVLGGAAAGAQIGSIIPGLGTGLGAVIGGGLDLLGGLFGGHHEDPLDTSKAKDPGLYNSPSDFEYAALRWHTLGRMPTSRELGMNLPSIAAPIVNITVNLDGVKQAVNKVISSQTSAGSTNLTSHYYDMSRP